MTLHSHSIVARRHFFRECGIGIGKIALAGLLTDALTGKTLGSPEVGRNPLAPDRRTSLPKPSA